MNSIYCPINKNYYDISSTEGRTVLKKYIKSLIGSSQKFDNDDAILKIQNILEKDQSQKSDLEKMTKSEIIDFILEKNIKKQGISTNILKGISKMKVVKLNKIQKKIRDIFVKKNVIQIILDF